MTQKTNEQIPVFHYKTHFLLNALMDGAHRSKRQGPGSEFYRKAAFLADPNPARVDLTRSLTDPFETLYVKTFRQRSELDVVILADGSHSMLTNDKAAFLTQALACINESVNEAGDKQHNYLLTETIQTLPEKPDWQALLHEIYHAQHPHNAGAFTALSSEVPAHHSLIFLLSDFHWPESSLQSVLATLSAHTVIPVIIWSSAETARYPLWRFVQVKDAESTGQHLLFMTPRQQQQIEQAFSDRKKHLNQLFNAHGYRPLWLSEPFSAHQISRYFLGE